MNEQTDEQQDQKAWTKKTLDAAVYQLIDDGIFENSLVEAKPAWALPFVLLIGKIRPRGSGQKFSWFIAGDCPTSYVDSSVANSPREAARHFALKWQLAAEGEAQTDPSIIDYKVEQKIEQAEALYDLVELDHLWANKS